MPESIESSNFFSHKMGMSKEFGWRKDSNSKKIEQRPQILVELSFRALCDSKLSGLCPFDNNSHFIELKIG